MPSADFLGTSEPTYTNMFLVYFTRLPNITPLYVESMTIPEPSWGVVPSSYFIATRKFAGASKLGDAALTVKDFVNVDTAAACYAWFKSVGDPNAGTLNPPATYKSSGVIIVTDGRGNPVNTWTLKGCFPMNCKTSDLKQGDASTIIEITMNISVDVIELS